MSDPREIFEWLELLDHLDYYELLRVPQGSPADEIRDAYHRFASSFHPDQHVGRSPAERSAVDQIFKRGTEAYSALTDPALRHRYDEALLQTTPPSAPPRLHDLLTAPPPRVSAPPPRASVPPPAGPQPASVPPQRLEDRVQSGTVRPFARRAEELAALGDFKQAKLQILVARSREPDNGALNEYLAFIEAQLKKSRPPGAP